MNEKHNVVTFCDKKEFDVKQIFVSPLSDDDYLNNNCNNDKHRTDFTEKTMLNKLRKRASDSAEGILKRANKAIIEVEDARKLRDKGEKNFVYFVNHFGEDMKSEWESLKQRVGKVPEYWDKTGEGFVHKAGSIDKTFSQFLEIVFKNQE